MHDTEVQIQKAIVIITTIIVSLGQYNCHGDNVWKHNRISREICRNSLPENVEIFNFANFLYYDALGPIERLLRAGEKFMHIRRVHIIKTMHSAT